MLAQRISQILEDRFAAGSADFGEAESQATLGDELNEAANRSFGFLVIAAIMTVCLFAVMIWLLIKNSNQPATFAAISAVIGLTFAGLISLMIRFSKEYTQGILLGKLAKKLPEQDVQAVMLTLIKGDKN